MLVYKTVKKLKPFVILVGGLRTVEPHSGFHPVARQLLRTSRHTHYSVTWQGVEITWRRVKTWTLRQAETGCVPDSHPLYQSLIKNVLKLNWLALETTGLYSQIHGFNFRATADVNNTNTWKINNDKIVTSVVEKAIAKKWRKCTYNGSRIIKMHWFSNLAITAIWHSVWDTGMVGECSKEI